MRDVEYKNQLAGIRDEYKKNKIKVKILKNKKKANPKLDIDKTLEQCEK